MRHFFSATIVLLVAFLHSPAEMLSESCDSSTYSPDHSYLAFLKPSGASNCRNIFIRNVKTGEEHALTDTAIGNIIQLAWANNDRLLFTQDKMGDDNTLCYAVNLDGSGKQLLTPLVDTCCKLVDELPNDPAHVLIAHNRINRSIFDLYLLDVNSGKMQPIYPRIKSQLAHVQPPYQAHFTAKHKVYQQ